MANILIIYHLLIKMAKRKTKERNEKAKKNKKHSTKRNSRLEQGKKYISQRKSNSKKIKSNSVLKKKFLFSIIFGLFWK